MCCCCLSSLPAELAFPDACLSCSTGGTCSLLPAHTACRPAAAAAACASPAELDFLVALQAFLTVVGNCTLWWAAWRVFTATQAEQASS
jgi:hypothetical protein